jgi:hypothetical protein
MTLSKLKKDTLDIIEFEKKNEKWKMKNENENWKMKNEKLN